MRIQPSYNQLFNCPYSFQAQEHDDELKGDGNSVNYKYRMLDPRLGRFFAIDPLSATYPYNSNYAFSENIVVNAIELEGLEKIYTYIPDKENGGWKKIWTETDNNLKENVNRYVTFDVHGDVSKVTIQGSKTQTKVTYNKKEDRNNMYMHFKSTAESKMSQGVQNALSFAQMEVSPDATHYDPLIGNDDGAGLGGKLGGEKGWSENGGKELFFGTLTLVTAPVTFASTTLLGTALNASNVISAVDDLGGLLVNEFTQKSNSGFESLSQSLTSSKSVKTTISKVKSFISLASLGSGAISAVKLLKPSNVTTPNQIGTVIGVISDGVQAKGNFENVTKK